MVMAVQKQEEPAIHVDQSRKYPTSAGMCDKCGYYKTWMFKIVNPKTGKQVPGHVTKEGFKINDGDCPFYALLKQKATGSASQEIQEFPEAQPAAPEQVVKRTAPRPAPAAGEQRFALTVELQEGEIVAKIGPCATKLAKADAVMLAKVLIDMVAS